MHHHRRDKKTWLSLYDKIVKFLFQCIVFEVLILTFCDIRFDDERNVTILQFFEQKKEKIAIQIIWCRYGVKKNFTLFTKLDLC